MDSLINLLQHTDIGVVLVILVSFYLYDKRMERRFDKIDQRFDKLDEKVTDIDRRLCRLEGAFASKDCCMIKDDRHHKAAE